MSPALEAFLEGNPLQDRRPRVCWQEALEDLKGSCLACAIRPSSANSSPLYAEREPANGFERAVAVPQSVNLLGGVRQALIRGDSAVRSLSLGEC
jgi:hypothetical protein